ncbi:PH domain-containing protein [Numidum massiliense]|uniref:PH domain-containing protein n=1 Tax=Numidum massiliense TaxID=1522315 RepID=UPI0006D5321D|nr:PH domain-containing protein [Numidum massiliense]
MRPEPSERIDPRAVKVWRIAGGIVSSILVLGALILVYMASFHGWWWIFSAAAGVLAIIYTLIGVVIAPTIRWRRWRYEITEREIDLRHGVFFIKRTLIPMVRVQHVDTSQGPLMRRYGLATVSVSTAAGEHEIPALTVEAADALRDQIAELAGVADDV